jgi:uroporphyrinogen decarboxylase
MNKREAVLAVLDKSKPQTYIPAAFFLHFPPAHHLGQAAVEEHLEFFRYTGMDFVKIQYERKFPADERIRQPKDWAQVKPLKRDYFEPMLEAVEGLVKAAGKEALVIVTLYSPFMCAGHIAGDEMLIRHIAEDPDAVNRGLEIVTENLMVFVNACIELGVDGFYHSTQGYEKGRLASPELFHRCVKPWDLRVMQEVNARCPFNVLHVCDYHMPYADLDPFPEYPGSVVNVNPVVGDRRLSGEEIIGMFGRPFMGGVDRLGKLATGSVDDARAAAREALSQAPDRFILAADCTVPSDTPWDNLRAAIEEAHRWSG